MIFLRWRTLVVLMALCFSGAVGVHAQANFQMTPSGLKYLITEYGRGLQARAGRVLVVHYVAKLRDGTLVDSTRDRQPVVFRLGKEEVMPGWDEGFRYMHGGGKMVLVVPPELLGDGKPLPKAPPKVQIVFDVELLEVREEK
jgi:FKBP-type peptidyl-prolyl cis-trans isomerase